MIHCTFENGNTASLRHVVVHAIVESQGALLLVKRAPSLLEGGKWSLPSGFLDRDETAGEAALRELREETGWEGRVEALFSVTTNPNRRNEDRQNVAFFYLVTAVRDTGVHDDESTEVSWVPLGALPPAEAFAFDHGEAVMRYLAYRSKPFPLPIAV